MIIRKLFKFEGSHIVRNCTTKRCSENIHGHSYKVELLFKSEHLDNGGMVLDFGIIKNSRIGRLLDAFDHTHLIWESESNQMLEFIINNTKRWIVMPMNPSAESIALTLFWHVRCALIDLELKNGEALIELHSVIVHETETGYAQAFEHDLSMYPFEFYNIDPSEEIREEMGYE